MNPLEVVYNLRRIAAKIDASKNPNRTLVARDLRTILQNTSTQAALIEELTEERHHEYTSDEYLASIDKSLESLKEIIEKLKLIADESPTKELIDCIAQMEKSVYKPIKEASESFNVTAEQKRRWSSVFHYL